MKQKYDIAIIGSGIAGSCLATILAKQGKRVIVFEAKNHPRFAIGESMILEASETLRAMAQFYEIPELAYYSSENYMPLIGTSHGVKRHFSFLHHSEGKYQNKQKAFQAVIPNQPHGHELHLFRQDSDQFMVATAISYGAKVYQDTAVSDIDITSEVVNIKTSAGDFSADYIVDAGGFKSILAEKFQLRDYDLKTHSRTIFTHMVNVPDYHQTGLSQQEYGFPFSVAEGTLHHIFEGGWLWVIPFNNHQKSTNPLCSVGLQLDTRHYPEDKTLSAKEEFCAFVSRFPDLKKQLENTKAVRSWTRTGRIQYTSKQVVGERFALLAHAAGFIDPLFSKGMYVSFNSVSTLVHLILTNEGDFSAETFKPYEQQTLAFVQSHDRLVANSYKSFTNHKLWSVYKVLWLLGAYTEFVKLTSSRKRALTRNDYYREIASLSLTGGGFDEYKTLAEQIDTLIEQLDVKNEQAVDYVVAEINNLFLALDWLPQAFRETLKGKPYLPKNKLRWQLLKWQAGFMGSGEFRKHFFNNKERLGLVKDFLTEKIKYATISLVRKKMQQKNYLSFSKGKRHQY
ncbi:MAG: NAD(P)/FAD-dependent oxidoreductase [Methylococcaceae bacterium]